MITVIYRPAVEAQQTLHPSQSGQQVDDNGQQRRDQEQSSYHIGEFAQCQSYISEYIHNKCHSKIDLLLDSVLSVTIPKMATVVEPTMGTWFTKCNLQTHFPALQSFAAFCRLKNHCLKKLNTF